MQSISGTVVKMKMEGSAVEEDPHCNGNTLTEGTWKPGRSESGSLTGIDGKADGKKGEKVAIPYRRLVLLACRHRQTCWVAGRWELVSETAGCRLWAVAAASVWAPGAAVTAVLAVVVTSVAAAAAAAGHSDSESSAVNNMWSIQTFAAQLWYIVVNWLWRTIILWVIISQ